MEFSPGYFIKNRTMYSLLYAVKLVIMVSFPRRVTYDKSFLHYRPDNGGNVHPEVSVNFYQIKRRKSENSHLSARRLDSMKCQ